MENIAREQYGIELGHLGINAHSKEEATEIAKSLCDIGMEISRETPISYFLDETVEIMFSMGPGTNGHIGFVTDDMDGAIKYIRNLGYEFDESSKTFTPDGKIKLIYLKGEFAGFAVHLVTKPPKFTRHENPQGIEYVHFGVNRNTKEEAAKFCEIFNKLFGMQIRVGANSSFLDEKIEVTHKKGAGAKGHIGFKAQDHKKGMDYVESLGYHLDWNDVRYTDEGVLRNIYIKEEISTSGFGFHVKK